MTTTPWRLHFTDLCPFAASASSAGARGGFGSRLKVHLRYIWGADDVDDDDEYEYEI